MRWLTAFFLCFIFSTETLAQRTKMVNGVAVVMSPQEEANYAADEAARAQNKLNREAAFVPPAVAQYQWRAALAQMSRLAAFLTYVQGLPAAGQQFWLYKKVIKRTAPDVVALKSAPLNLTDAQLDGIFKLAATFEE